MTEVTTLDCLSEFYRTMKDVAIEINAPLVGFDVTHYKYKVIKNDLGDRVRELEETVKNVKVLITFPNETPIASGSEGEFIEDLLPITLQARYKDKFKLNDVIEVHRKDKFNNIATEFWELVDMTSLTVQSNLDEAFVLAPYRQDQTDGIDDITEQPDDVIMDIPPEDLINNPVNDQIDITGDDDTILKTKNRANSDPYDDFDEL